MVQEKSTAVRFVLDSVESSGSVVTLKSVARSLALGWAEARSALEEAAEEGGGLSRVWWISGERRDGRRWVGLVPDARLPACKAALATLHSCSIYSLQKGVVSDLAATYAADRAEESLDSLRDRIAAAPVRCHLPQPRTNRRFPAASQHSNGSNGSRSNATPPQEAQNPAATTTQTHSEAKEAPTASKPAAQLKAKPTSKGSKAKNGNIATMFSTMVTKPKPPTKVTPPIPKAVECFP